MAALTRVADPTYCMSKSRPFFIVHYGHFLPGLRIITVFLHTCATCCELEYVLYSVCLVQYCIGIRLSIVKLFHNALKWTRLIRHTGWTSMFYFVYLKETFMSSLTERRTRRDAMFPTKPNPEQFCQIFLFIFRGFFIQNYLYIRYTLLSKDINICRQRSQN